MMIVYSFLMVATGLLWFLDEILTLKDTHKYGLLSERNPVMKYFLRRGKTALISFKIMSFGIFAFLMYIILQMHLKTFYFISVGVILIYLAVDASNFMFFEKNR